jgi:glycosyltransferase involved in cell wall biosynthesis
VLAILTTHPIQYQTPIWRGLAARGDVPFKVFYMSDQGLRARFDPGFGRDVAWDIDLLDGYPYEFLDVHTGPRQESFRWLRLKRGFGRMLRNQGVTVLWVQGWQVMAYWQAIREARRTGVDVWVRGDTNLRSNAGGLKQSFKRLVLKRLLNRVDRFLTTGKANRDFYLRLGFRAERMVDAPHCVDNRRFAEQAAAFRPTRAQLRAAWNIPEDAFCFLSVGKFIGKKNPLDLVEAVRRLQKQMPGRNLHILWVGAGELDEALHEACSVLFDHAGGAKVGSVAGEKPSASFAGFLNQGEIGRAYVAADTLVLPSDAKETWGLVVNEAMATGLPCVVSDACGCADDLVLPLFPELCFPVGDINALVRSLAQAITSPPPADRLEEKIANFDTSRTVDSVAALYQRVVRQ